MASSGSLIFSNEHLPLEKIGKQYSSVKASIQLYFSHNNPQFSQIFQFYSRQELLGEHIACILEHELGTSMTILAAMEAAFRIDFELRCQSMYVDAISIQLRQIQRGRTQHSISFVGGILNGWNQAFPAGREIISAMRDAYQFRNWLAHGRYWIPDVNKFDYGDLYALAENVFTVFPLKN